MFQISDIIWGRVRGYPWWPGRVLSPTQTQLQSLSIAKVPPDQRLVWFFNDNDNYTLINIKNLRPFCDEQITVETKNKVGKNAERLKQAFEQASAEYRRLTNLEEDEAIDAIVITPSNDLRARSSTRHPRISKKRKNSDLNGLSTLDELPSKQINNKKRRRAENPTNASHARPKSAQDVFSHKKRQSTGGPSTEAESDRLSTHCNPSPCDRSSQETGIDSRTNVAEANRTPIRSNLLRLRIREKPSSIETGKRGDSCRPQSSASRRRVIEQGAHTSSSEEKLRKKEQHGSLGTRGHCDHSVEGRANDITGNGDMKSRTDYAERPRRDKNPKESELPSKLRHDAVHNAEDAAERKRLAGTKGSVERENLGLSEMRRPDYAMQATDIANGDDEGNAAQARLHLSEPRPSNKVTGMRETKKVSRSEEPLRRSRRMRKMSSKMAGTDEESTGGSEDDGRQLVASKRSRGIEAPRKSDGQRRLHIREEYGNRYADPEDKGEDGKRAARNPERVAGGRVSDGNMDDAAEPFEALSKDECIKVILKMQKALRRKNVELWLRGRKLVDSRNVVRTEEGLIKACEAALEKAEKLLRWARKHDGYDKGEGSRFAKMETKAAEECEVLIDVYFDRRRVSLKKTGYRILKITKELPPYSRKVTEMLQELLVLWLDLTSDSSKKVAPVKSKHK